MKLALALLIFTPFLLDAAERQVAGVVSHPNGQPVANTPVVLYVSLPAPTDPAKEEVRLLDITRTNRQGEFKLATESAPKNGKLFLSVRTHPDDPLPPTLGDGLTLERHQYREEWLRFPVEAKTLHLIVPKAHSLQLTIPEISWAPTW